MITILYRQHKKASSTHKLTSLYLIDAIARGARSKYKKQGKSKEPEEGSTTPKDGPVGEVGTYGSFLKKLEGILSKIVLDVWENAPAEHRVSFSFSRSFPRLFRLPHHVLNHSLPHYRKRFAKYSIFGRKLERSAHQL